VSLQKKKPNVSRLTRNSAKVGTTQGREGIGPMRRFTEPGERECPRVMLTKLISALEKNEGIKILKYDMYMGCV